MSNSAKVYKTSIIEKTVAGTASSHLLLKKEEQKTLPEEIAAKIYTNIICSLLLKLYSFINSILKIWLTLFSFFHV